MAEQRIHKYKAQFGQPESYHKKRDALRTQPISFELDGDPNAIDDQYHNVTPQDVIEVSEFNMSFTIHKTKDAGQADTITFYNLSKDARKRLEKNEAGNPLFVLYAGYETDNDIPLIFEGEVISVKQHWDGHTQTTQCTLKTAATNIKEAYTSRSYRVGERVENVFRDLFKDMGLAKGVISFGKGVVAANGILNKPLIINGATVDWIRKWSKQNGFTFTVHDGIANIFKSDEEIEGVVAYYISSETNMIGSPNIAGTDTAIQEDQPANKQTISVTTTLNGAYKIGDLVEVESREYKGIYAIDSIVHSGTYEGSDWFSRLELKPVNGWERKK